MDFSKDGIVGELQDDNPVIDLTDSYSMLS